jgi:hypothetical protein
LVQIFGDLYKKRRINRGICNQSWLYPVFVTGCGCGYGYITYSVKMNTPNYKTFQIVIHSLLYVKENAFTMTKSVKYWDK